MRASASLIVRWLGREARIIVFTAGLLAFSAGIGWIYLPAGLISGGLLASGIVVLERAGARHEAAE